jgi:predicted hydrocarbon binding protein
MNKIPNITLWGETVNTPEIADGIYQVDAVRQSGVMVRQSTAARELSEEAVTCGLQHGEWLYFDEDSQAVVFRELLDAPDCELTKDSGEPLCDAFTRCIDKCLREYCPKYWNYRMWRLTEAK